MTRPDPIPPIGPAERRSTLARASGLTLLAAAAGVALMGLPSGGIPMDRPDLWWSWWSATDPVGATSAAARLLGLAGCGYLAAIGAANVAVLAVTGRRPGRFLRTLTPRLVTGVTLGVVTASACSAPAAPSSIGTSDAPARMEVVGSPSDPAAASASSSVTTTSPPATDPPATDPGPPPTLQRVPAAAVPAVEPPEHPTSPAPTRRHVVAPGDHLWSIAEQAVASGPGAAGDVRAYWQALIEVNRDRLVDPDNPDLIFPGQELVLP